MIKNVKYIINQFIEILFWVLMVGIVIATIILDKNVDSAFPNTVTYANGGYYLLAMFFLICIIFIHRSLYGKKDVDKGVYAAFMIILPFVILGGWQIPVSRWIYWFTDNGDFGSIMYAAIGFNNGESFAEWLYFSHSPNNANLAILLSWIYKIIPDWRIILLLGAVLTNVSAVLVALAVNNITKSRVASMCTLVLSELLMAMTWRAFIVYTDNYGMIFIALMIWIYSLNISEKLKCLSIVVVAAIGTFIKVTIFIPFLAILIYKFLSFQKDNTGNWKLSIKKILYGLICFICIFSIMLIGQKGLRQYHKLDLEGQYPKGWQYMFMVGQNSEVYGVTNGVDLQIRNEIIEDAANKGESVDYVNQIFLEEALQRVKKRGVLGNIKFYINKLNVAYNDGYFHNVQTSVSPVSNELEPNILYDLLEKENGQYYQISAGVLQVAWDCVLLLLIISLFVLYKDNTFRFYKIVILGVTLYLMLFEGRSKYLYMFLPVYVTAAGLSYAKINKEIQKIDLALSIYEDKGDMKRKKVGIITFHFVNNFGGVLQAYALQRVVAQKCNAETEIIDYRNWFIRLTDRIRLFPISTSIDEIVSGFKTMKQRIQRRHKFGMFIKNNSKLSKKFLNHFQLNRRPPFADKYICGSDQIWNPFLTMGVSGNYFLDFESNPENKIAYAPSFGTDGVSKIYKKQIKKYLESIKYLSVREKSGQVLIKNMTGRDAERLIDPTFLLEKGEWESIGKNPLKNREPYILLYIMQRDIEVYDYARKIKEKMGIKLVEISRYGYNPGFVDETLISIGPDEFLGLFRDAAYICTNSYHGLAYSIIFEKDFCLIPCKRFTARINNMIDLLQIEEKSEGDDLESLTAGYDKEFVRNVINSEREKAFRFLKESIGCFE